MRFRAASEGGGKGWQKTDVTIAGVMKRMETIDDETLAAAKDFIVRQHEARKPFFCWWNGTRMHFRTHVKQEHMGISGFSGDEVQDGMVEHDLQLDYLSGKVKESPRKEFIYVNDDGQVVAMRYEAWKTVFLENRGQAFGKDPEADRERGWRLIGLRRKEIPQSPIPGRLGVL
jgi:hypothetical protein